MLSWVAVVLGTLRASLKSRERLALENLALRQQLAMLRQSVKRPRVRLADRVFWVLFAKYVSGWRALLYTLHPDTVVRWQRDSFRRYWSWKSRRHFGCCTSCWSSITPDGISSISTSRHTLPAPGLPSSWLKRSRSIRRLGTWSATAMGSTAIGTGSVLEA